MAHEFEDIQKYGKEQFDAAAAATTNFTKTLQAIATETADYSKKSFESNSAFVEKLLGAKSYESAIQNSVGLLEEFLRRLRSGSDETQRTLFQPRQGSFQADRNRLSKVPVREELSFAGSGRRLRQ